MDNTKIFGDLADLASTALDALSGIKEQMRENARGHATSFADQMDLATRADLDRLDGMLGKLRDVQEGLNARLAVIEDILMIKPTKPSAPKTKKAPVTSAQKKSATKTKAKKSAPSKKSK